MRSGTTQEEQGPSATANPDEINIDADYSSDEEESDGDSADGEKTSSSKAPEVIRLC